jgi:hypothetical protein
MFVDERDPSAHPPFLSFRAIQLYSSFYFACYFDALNYFTESKQQKHGLESGHEVISIDTYHVCFWMQRFCQPLTRLVFCAPIAFAFVLITSFWPT